MWYQIKSYIHFLINSKNKHGIHSPFVYDLVSRCFYDKSDYPEYSKLTTIRDSYTANKDIIEIEEFGAGSKVFNSSERTISSISRNAGIKNKNQKLLFRLVRHFNTSYILELGTSLGLATSAMSLANPTASIETVEGCMAITEIAQQMFDENDLKNISLYHSKFENYLSNLKERDISFDLIYLDGNHNKESTVHYYETFIDHIDNDSIVILDDIHWSSEMEQAWNEIAGRPEVSVSIDTYYWGLLFFRKEQEKQHFRIRL